MSLPTVVVEPIDIPMEDEPLHTVDHPFCDDPECECHDEYGPAAMESLHIPFDEGLLTEDEAIALYENRNI